MGTILELVEKRASAWSSRWASQREAVVERRECENLLQEVVSLAEPPVALRPVDVQAAAACAPAARATGACGWAAADVKCLRSQAWALLAGVFNRIEFQGQWPIALDESLIALLA